MVDNNPTYQYGDQITFFMVKQYVNAVTSLPYVVVSSAKVVLDAASDEKLVDVTGSSHGFASIDGKIGHSGNDGDCAYTWVHSRKSSGKLLVSSQSLLAANTKLAEYQGEMAYSLARTSYGITDDVYLSPSGEANGEAGGDDNGGGNGGGGNDTL